MKLCVFLHGLGDTPAGWAALKMQMPAIEWVFPAAPISSVTINGGAQMTSWFDVLDWPIGLSARNDVEGMKESVALIHKELEGLEARGVPASAIVLGGFSQGGAVAMSAAFSYKSRLAGCICLSGWLFEQDIQGGPPVFWGHGQFDNIVLPEQQEAGVEILKKAGIDVTSKAYPTTHSSHPDEIADMAAFLHKL